MIDFPIKLILIYVHLDVMKYKNSKISNIFYDCLLSILDSPEEKVEIYLGLRNVYV